MILLNEIKPWDDPARRIWRIAPTRNLYNGDYRSEGIVAFNFDATELWYTGNNGSPAINNDYKVFSVPIPADWATTLNGTSVICYLDADGDTYSDGSLETVETCSTDYYRAGQLTPGNGIDEDCDGVDLPELEAPRGLHFINT